MSVKGLAAAIIVVAVLAVISLFIGVSDVSLATLFGTGSTDRATEVC
jgi:iron complex transport system permease protein